MTRKRRYVTFRVTPENSNLGKLLKTRVASASGDHTDGLRPISRVVSNRLMNPLFGAVGVCDVGVFLVLLLAAKSSAGQTPSS